MDPRIKEQKLRRFAASVIDNPKYRDEIRWIFSKAKLTRAQVIQAYVDYDMDIYAYENEIFEPLIMRVVLHLHNLLRGSWHQERQAKILRMVKSTRAETAVDMGFGVPNRYIRELVLRERTPKLTLVDLYDSAFQFSRILFNYLDKSWGQVISFRKLDMNTHKYVGDFDCYIFQDSIEHVNNALAYLTKTVRQSPLNATFIFSLPVGPKIPVHTIAWSSTSEIIRWLQRAGLKVNAQQKVYVNPKVDLFAEKIEGDFYNVIASCKKVIK